MRRNYKLYFIFLGFVALTGLVWVCMEIMVRTPKEKLRETLPLEISLTQTISPVFSDQIAGVIKQFNEQHPKINVSVRFNASQETNQLQNRGVVLGGIDVLPGATPLFYGDYIVLVYNRVHVKTPPESFEQVVAEAVRLKASNSVRYGISLPNESYGIIPFLTRSLLDMDGADIAAPMDASARKMIADDIFGQDLSPKNCLTECVVDLMANGQTAFALVGEWRIPDLAVSLRENLAVSLIPVLQGNKGVLSPRRTYGLYIDDNVDNPTRQAALKLRAFLQRESARTMLFQTGKLPINDDGSLNSEVDGIAQFKNRTVEVPIKKYLAATSRLAPAWAALK